MYLMGDPVSATNVTFVREASNTIYTHQGVFNNTD